MSIGKRPSEGNRGNDLSFRSKVLRGLAAIAGNTGATGLLNQEITQLAVLNTLQNLLAENKLDFEIKSVKDANGDIFQLRGTLDEETGVFTWDYIDAEGNAYSALNQPGGPQGSVEFLNPDGLLSAILIELEAFNDKFITEVDDDAIAVEQELPTNINLLYGAYEGEGTEWERIQTDGNGQLKGIQDIITELQGINLDTNGLNQEDTQVLVKAVLDVIQTNTLNTANGITTANVTLNDIENELIALNNTAGTLATQATLNALLTAFNAEDFATSAKQDTLLSNIITRLNTLGQKVSAASAPVVLSTEQEAIFDAIKTAVENIDSDLGTGGLALETTQVAIQNLITSTNALLTTIDADTSNLDVLLSTRAADASVLATNALLTTIDGVLDAIKVDTGALVVDVAAIEVLITTTNSLLTTIDGVLDAIKLDTANLDVALSTVATEVTLNSLLTAFNNEDFASQTTLAAILACLCTDENSVRNLIQSIDADTGNIATSTANIDTTLTPATRTHNTVSATGAGNVPAGSMCGSVINIGGSAGTWNGISLPAGISIPWTQIGPRDTYGAIAYDATGTTFIIEYTT
jgi:hypothetical protein